jgi:hypothetical protein
VEKRAMALNAFWVNKWHKWRITNLFVNHSEQKNHEDRPERPNIPNSIELDSIVRIENILASTNYIIKLFDTNISVLEAAPYNNGFLKKLLHRSIEYNFIEDKDPIFHRTKYRNLLANSAQTPYFAYYDADIIVDKKQIIDSISKLRSNEADMAYPFDGRFYDTSAIIRDLYITTRKYQRRMSLPYGTEHKGGVVFVNAKKSGQAGKENESLYGWGPEDYERYERWKNGSPVKPCV